MVFLVQSVVERLASFCAKRAYLALGLCLLLAAGGIYCTAYWLKFNSDKESLVAETAPFKVRNARFNAAFPEFENSLLVVIDGPSSASAQNAAELIGAGLQQRPDQFPSVFLGTADLFYRDHGLLFLSPEELEALSARLARQAPALASFAAEPDLRGLLALLRLGARSQRPEDSDQFEPVLDELLAAVKAVQAGGPQAPIRGLFDRDGADTRRVLVVQPRLDFTSQGAERAAVDLVRRIVNDTGVANEHVQVRLTGTAALADDEILAIEDSVALAGFLSTLLAGCLLWFTLRSWRMIVAILFTLTIGLSWTMGFAALAVGSLNMISAAVIVLFIGLGIDHGIHFTFRYREALRAGDHHSSAIAMTARELGSPIFLCATTSAIGFAAFIPTDYRGLAELGVIAAGSIFLALIASFTLLPALLTILRADKDTDRGPEFDRPFLISWLTQHSQMLSLLFAIAAIFAVIAAGSPRFDFSTLTIRDRTSESVITLEDLQASGFITEYAAEILVENDEEALRAVAALSALPEVGAIHTSADLVPSDQGIKLEILEDTRSFLWSALNPPASEPISPRDREALIADFQTFALSLNAERATGQKTQELATLLLALSASHDQTDQIGAFEQVTVTPLIDDLAWLRRALDPSEIRFDDLPASVRERFVGQNGEQRITAVSHVPLVDTASLQTFVDAVRRVEPHATGRAFTEVDVGTLVVKSFYEAGLIALVGISALLLFVLRSFRDTFFVMVPLMLAACYTLASAALFQISFNFANIIVLPLIFGLGVDSGIHFVMRRRAASDVDHVMHSSTPQAILFSALSTIAAFSALSLSRHWGLASMGILLTIAVFWVIVSTVIILPALMDWRDKMSARASAAV
ncbi:MAG: MMPL family transporter [Parvibaculum sp.]